MRPASQPVITHSGRQVKPTQRAQAASEQAQTNAGGRRNKGKKNISQVEDKRAANGSVPAGCQKKSSVQTSPDRTVSSTPSPSQAGSRVVVAAPLKTTSKHPKHRSIRPSNLALPPISPGSLSTPGKTHPRPVHSSKSKPSASTPAVSPKVIGSSESNPSVHASSRLKIILPKPSLPATTVPAMGSALGNTADSSSQKTPPVGVFGTTNKGGDASPSGGTQPRRLRNRRGRDGGRGREDASLTLGTETRQVLPDDTKAPPTAYGPVGTGNAVVTAIVNPPVVRSGPVDSLRNAVGTRSRSRSRGIDNSIGTPDTDTPSSSRTGKPHLPPDDPGHPEGKKRKLDGCED